MKKIIIVVLMLPLFAKAQQKIQPTLPLKTVDRNEIDKFVGKAMSVTKYSYKITDIDTLEKDDFGRRNVYSVTLTSIDNGVNEIRINYLYYMEGENRALEKRGTKTYYFESINGTRYLDLFEIWKRFFDPNADAIKIAGTSSTDGGGWIRYYSPLTSNVDPNGSDRVSRFMGSSKGWIILK